MAAERTHGYTVADLAIRYRVSPDRIRHWIMSGLLRAINRRDIRSARPSWVIPPDAIAEFERGRAAAPPTTTPTPKRRKKTNEVDFYP